MSFQDSLAFGQTAESDISRWLIRRGNVVLPVYEKIIDTGKGPQLFTSAGPLIAPDLVAIKDHSITWIEAKHKTAFTWHRITGRWVTGVDLRHYNDYVEVREAAGFPVWLLFLHRGGQAKDSPANSPSGLFGNDIVELMKNENHRHDNWGRSGMVYWARAVDGGPLVKLAKYAQVAQQ